MSTAATLEVVRKEGYWQGRFSAMASPCEVLIDTDDEHYARKLIQLARQEALRIEAKFSRYRDDNIVHQINNARGKSILVDAETQQLLDYAQQCYELSEHRFDITSGVLREIWKFDGSDRLPNAEAVKNVLARVGWHRVQWSPPSIQLPERMEIDLGGVGKEFAVDRSALILREQSCHSALINYGGDIHVLGPRRDGRGWHIGLEDPRLTSSSLIDVCLQQGAVATSGDSHRYLLHKGRRYSHILDPTNGWPVAAAPRSVTVLAPSCLEAGMLSTFAMLQGKEAEAFLQAEEVKYWCIW